MRRTKIVCTIGPASESEEMMTKLAEAGMNVARLNFSHGTHEEHLKKIKTIGKGKKEKKKYVIANEYIDIETKEMFEKDKTGKFTKINEGKEI